MPDARLEVTDSRGRRIVSISKPVFSIGRRVGNDLEISGSDVSRDHAEIAREDGGFVLRDRGSRFGTHLNGEPITECPLKHGDLVRLGKDGGVEMLFLLEDVHSGTVTRQTASAVDDLHQVSALLEGLRAVGSGRVLSEVLALVIDSALEVASAERGFIMLAGPDGKLEFKIARGKGRVTLPGSFSTSTSQKIPEQVFTTGKARMVADLLEATGGDNTSTVMLGIRQVFCMPLKVVRFVDQADAPVEERRIGVLYLDSQKKGALASPATQSSLEMLATEAAMAIENARLYRQALEKAKMEQELKIAAEIQQQLLPDAQRKSSFFEAVAQSVPCRSIGGDFYDYVELADVGFGFAVGDVAGKGAPAALLTAVIQGMFTALASLGMPPSQTLSGVNKGIFARAIESRFCTAFYAVITPGGQLAYCNAGHNPPMVFTRTGVRRLDKGGTFLGVFEHAAFEQEIVTLEPGDILVAFSDGVTEAMNTAEEEYGEDRLQACIEAAAGKSPQEMLDAVLLSVREFSRGADQSDDITALVLRYDG